MKTVAAQRSKSSTDRWWEKAVTPQPEAQKKILQTINFNLGKFDDKNRTFTAIASTALVDRQGDVIEQAGWELDNFMKNPVIPWAHDYYQPPVGRVTEIGVTDGVLQFTYQAPPAGMYEFADLIWNYYRNQYMFAFSVGFIPLEGEGDYIEGFTFSRCELLEISAVVVPANPQALALAYKMGIADKRQTKQLIDKLNGTVKNLEEVLADSEEDEKKKDKTAAIKAGASLSSANKDFLGEILDALHTIDVLVDKYQPLLAELLGVPNPDIDDPDAPNEGDEQEKDSAKSVDQSLTKFDQEVARSIDNLSAQLAEVLENIKVSTNSNEKDLTDDISKGDSEDMATTKSGAAISAANREKLQAVHDGMKDVMDALSTHAGELQTKADTLAGHCDSIKSLLSTQGDETTAKPKEGDDGGDGDGDEKSKADKLTDSGKSVKPATKAEADADGGEVNNADSDKDSAEGADQGSEVKEGDEPEEKETEVPVAESEKDKETKEVEVEAPAEKDPEVDPENLTDEQAEEIVRAVNESLKEKETN